MASTDVSARSLAEAVPLEGCPAVVTSGARGVGKGAAPKPVVVHDRKHARDRRRRNDPGSQ